MSCRLFGAAAHRSLLRLGRVDRASLGLQNPADTQTHRDDEAQSMASHCSKDSGRAETVGTEVDRVSDRLRERMCAFQRGFHPPLLFYSASPASPPQVTTFCISWIWLRHKHEQNAHQGQVKATDARRENITTDTEERRSLRERENIKGMQSDNRSANHSYAGSHGHTLSRPFTRCSVLHETSPACSASSVHTHAHCGGTLFYPQLKRS